MKGLTRPCWVCGGNARCRCKGLCNGECGFCDGTGEIQPDDRSPEEKRYDDLQSGRKGLARKWS